jgi:hypothetical protein
MATIEELERRGTEIAQAEAAGVAQLVSNERAS